MTDTTHGAPATPNHEPPVEKGSFFDYLRRKMPLFSLQWLAIRNISLRPYGKALCTPGAYFWIVCARTAIFLMAACEALSWAYMGSYLGEKSLGRIYGVSVSGLIVGATVFLIIWILDATFMTLDTARSFYERHLSVQEKNRKDDEEAEKEKRSGILKYVIGGFEFVSEHLIQPLFKNLNWKIVAGIGVRVGIIGMSFILTAPFLALIVFNHDIDTLRSQENAAMIDKAKRERESAYDAELKVKKLECDDIRKRLEIELAGKGTSGNYGVGPVSDQLKLDLAHCNGEYAAKEHDKNTEISDFASLSLDELAKKYQLTFQTTGIEADNKVLKSIEDRPSYKKADIAIKGFLALLFLSIFGLKFFQPQSIKIYYSEKLQSLYQDYLRGAFDSWLEEYERASNGKHMSPLRFEEWCLHTYASVMQDDVSRIKIGKYFEDLLRKSDRKGKETDNDISLRESKKRNYKHKKLQFDELILETERLILAEDTVLNNLNNEKHIAETDFAHLEQQIGENKTSCDELKKAIDSTIASMQTNIEEAGDMAGIVTALRRRLGAMSEHAEEFIKNRITREGEIGLIEKRVEASTAKNTQLAETMKSYKSGLKKLTEGFLNDL